MNTSQKGDRLALVLKNAALAKGISTVVKVRSSGHMGRRGGVAADVVVGGYKVEAKNYRRGVSSGTIEEALYEQGVHAVLHKRARGKALVTMDMNDWLDLVAARSE